MTFKPLHDNVLVKRHEKPEGKIILTDALKGDSMEGTVISVGPGYDLGDKRYLMTVKPGQHVMFEKYCGQDLEVDGETYRMMPENKIIGYFE